MDTNINFYKLNFPNNRIEIKNLTEYEANNFWTIETDVKKILSKELNDLFSDLKIYPSFAVFFVSQYGFQKDRHDLAHIDYTFHKNVWKPVPFAINWELNPDICSRLSWYDVSGSTEIGLKETDDKKINSLLNYLNGIFFKDNVKVIDYVDYLYGDVILVRTDVPHTLSDFKTKENKRFCLSLRFDIEEISSWDQAVDIFKKYIIKKI